MSRNMKNIIIFYLKFSFFGWLDSKIIASEQPTHMGFNYFFYVNISTVVLISICSIGFIFLINRSLNSSKFTSHKVFFITKTCLHNFDHIKPYFYIVKLGFTGVYIIFLISAQNIYCDIR